MENSNKRRLQSKLRGAFGNDEDFARYYSNLIKGLPGYRDPDEMTPEEFNEFIKLAVQAVGDESSRLAYKHRGDNYGAIHQRGGETFKTSWPYTWTRDSFLKTLGREGSKDPMATPLQKDPHIGSLSIGDRNKLIYSGLTDEEIDMLADKFRKEYQDKKISEIEDAEVRRKQAENTALANEYRNSAFGRLSGVIANEITNTIAENIENGNYADIDWADYLKSLAKATGIDAGIWAASLYGGGLLSRLGGKVISKIPHLSRVTDKIPNTVKNLAAPIGAIGLDALADAGAELGRQQVSDYHNGTDWKNVYETGKTSATLPGGVAATTAVLAQIPGTQKIFRPIMKQIRGNIMSTGEKEASRIEDLFSDIEKLSKESENNAFAGELLQERLAEAKKFLETHPLTDGPIDYETIKRIASDPEARAAYTVSPSMEEMNKILEVKQGRANPDEAMKMFNAETPEMASDLASQKWDKVKQTFPAAVEDAEDILSAPTLVNAGKVLNNWVVPARAKYEVATQRGNSEKKRAYSKPVEIDPILEELWKKKMMIRNGNQEINPLYIEWLKTHPEFAN